MSVRITLFPLLRRFAQPSRIAICPDSGPFVISDHVRAVATDDGAVILDLKRDRCYSLDPVGSLVWRLLLSGRTPREIYDLVAAACRMSPDRIDADLQQVVTQLFTSGLITLKDARGN